MRRAARFAAACSADLRHLASGQVKGRSLQVFGLWYCLVNGLASFTLSLVLSVALREHAALAACVAFPTGAVSAYLAVQGWNIYRATSPERGES